MTPTKQQALEHLRKHYGLSLTELCALLNFPVHPKTMRDEMAQAALPGYIAAAGVLRYEFLADHAYLMADAMLARRLQS